MNLSVKCKLDECNEALTNDQVRHRAKYHTRLCAMRAKSRRWYAEHARSDSTIEQLKNSLGAARANVEVLTERIERQSLKISRCLKNCACGAADAEFGPAKKNEA